jgi:hypothetical protein
LPGTVSHIVWPRFSNVFNGRVKDDCPPVEVKDKDGIGAALANPTDQLELAGSASAPAPGIEKHASRTVYSQLAATLISNRDSVVGQAYDALNVVKDIFQRTILNANLQRRSGSESPRIHGVPDASGCLNDLHANTVSDLKHWPRITAIETGKRAGYCNPDNAARSHE